MIIVLRQYTNSTLRSTHTNKYSSYVYVASTIHVCTYKPKSREACFFVYYIHVHWHGVADLIKIVCHKNGARMSALLSHSYLAEHLFGAATLDIRSVTHTHAHTPKMSRTHVLTCLNVSVSSTNKWFLRTLIEYHTRV